MRAVVVEFKDEARRILEVYGKDFLCSRDTLVVCLHPAVAVFLRENGIAVHDTLDFFDNSKQQAIVLEVEAIITDLTRDLDLKDDRGLEKGYLQTFAYHARFYINHFMWIIKILEGIHEKYAIKELICCWQPQGIPYSGESRIQDNERFLGFIARDFCRACAIAYKPVTLGLSRTDRFGATAAAAVRVVGILAALIDYQRVKVLSRRPAKTIVVPAVSYNMGALLETIKQKETGVRCVMVWEGKKTLKQELFKIYLMLGAMLGKGKSKDVLEAVICLELLKPFLFRDFSGLAAFKQKAGRAIDDAFARTAPRLNAGGVDFGGYLQEKINRGLKPELGRLFVLTGVLDKVLRLLKPRLLISMYSAGIYYTMGELSRSLGFVSLSVSHGTHVPPGNEFEKIENYRLATSVIINAYTHVAVQTPWADKFLDYYRDERPRVICGPLIYSRKDKARGDRLKQTILGLPAKSRVVTHASTQKTRWSLRFHIEETLDEYIASLCDIVNAVDQTEGLYFVLRPHPVCDISRQDFLKLLPPSDKICVMDQGSFKDVLSVTDLLISYSSTCIEEALQSNIPVVLYDKWKRYNHFNVPGAAGNVFDVKAPVRYIVEPDTLTRYLLDFSKNPLVSQDLDLSGYVYPADCRAQVDSFLSSVLA